MQRKYGKSNHRKILRMADEMADESQKIVRSLPDWAGLAWITDPYYNVSWRMVKEAMGKQWWAKACMLCRALKIARQK